MLVDDLIVEVRDGDYIRQGQFVEADLGNFLCVPRANSIGSWSIDLPDSIELDDGTVVSHPLCLLLRTPASGIVVTDPTGVILSGPMRSAIHSSSTDDPGGTWTLSGVSDTTVIAECEAWPQPSNSDGTTQTVANDVRTAVAETLLHQFLSANIGPAASVARKNPILTMGTDLARGPLLTKSPRYQNMLELFQEITAGTDLLFDIVQVGDLLQLRTWEADDLTADIRMDIANNQLDSIKYQYAAPGVTIVNVLGQDVGVDRQFVQRTTAASLAAATLWGVRIEKTLDQRQTDDVTELEQAGDEDLANEGDTITSLQIVPSDDQQQSFNVGDYVTVVVGTEQVAAQVTEKPIQVTAGSGVFVGATVGDPYAFDWESLIDGQVTDLTKRISALERTVEVPASLYSQAQVDALIAAAVADVEGDMVRTWRPFVPSGIASSGATATLDSTTGVVTVPTGATAVRIDGVLDTAYEVIAVLNLAVESGNASDYSMLMRMSEGGVPNTSSGYETAGNWAQFDGTSGIYNVNNGTYCGVGAVSGLASYVEMTTTIRFMPYATGKVWFNTFESFTSGSARGVKAGGYSPSATTAYNGVYFFPFAGTFKGTIRFYRRPL